MTILSCKCARNVVVNLAQVPPGDVKVVLVWICAQGGRVLDLVKIHFFCLKWPSRPLRKLVQVWEGTRDLLIRNLDPLIVHVQWF